VASQTDLFTRDDTSRSPYKPAMTATTGCDTWNATRFARTWLVERNHGGGAVSGVERRILRSTSEFSTAGPLLLRVVGWNWSTNRRRTQSCRPSAVASTAGNPSATRSGFSRPHFNLDLIRRSENVVALASNLATPNKRTCPVLLLFAVSLP
jgi:hypothetical protein